MKISLSESDGKILNFVLSGSRRPEEDIRSLVLELRATMSHMSGC